MRKLILLGLFAIIFISLVGSVHAGSCGSNTLSVQNTACSGEFVDLTVSGIYTLDAAEMAFCSSNFGWVDFDIYLYEEDWSSADDYITGVSKEFKAVEGPIYCQYVEYEHTFNNILLSDWAGGVEGDTIEIYGESHIKNGGFEGTCYTSVHDVDIIYGQCGSGVCCDLSTCSYKSSSYICASGIQTDYGCPWGTDFGDDVGVRYQNQYCSGSNSECTGTTAWSAWSVQDYCSSNEKCIDNNPTCQSVSCSSNSDCGTNDWVGSPSCNGDDVWQDYRTYTCANPGTPSSSCSYSDNYQLKESCPQSCSGGSCSIECSNDVDCGGSCWWINADYCSGGDVYDTRRCDKCYNPGTTSSFCSYSNSDQLKEDCTNGCSNGECIDTLCNSDPDCGTNSWVGSPSCNGGDVWQNYRTYTCINPGTPTSSCSYSDNYQLKQVCPESCNSGTCVGFACNSDSDCGTNGWVSSPICNGDDVWQDYRTYTCNNPGTSSSSCTYSDNYQLKIVCPDTCSGGVCASIECNSNSDCGTDTWIGSPTCNGDDVWQDYRTYTCANPGTPSSACSYFDNYQLKEDCVDTCNNGACADIACYSSSDCGTDGLIDSPYCDNDDVYRLYRTYSCTNPGTISSTCSYSDTPQLIEDCPYACQSGSCSIACSSNSNCGINGWVSSPICNGDDVWQDYRTYTCINPGTTSSSCTYSDNYQLKEECIATCTAGQCDAIECFNIADCPSDGWADVAFCKNDNVRDVYKTHTCENPGLTSSLCSFTTHLQDEFNDSKTQENLTFTYSNEEIIRYIPIEQHSILQKATLDLKGYNKESWLYQENPSSLSVEDQYFYTWYNKPGNVIDTVWQVKHGTLSNAAYNITLPSSCKALNPLQLRIYSYEAFGTSTSHPECYGTSWNSIGNTYDVRFDPSGSWGDTTVLYDGNWNTGIYWQPYNLWKEPFCDQKGATIWEEAMWWHLDSYPSNLKIDVLDDSSIDYQDDNIWDGGPVSTDDIELNVNVINNFLADCETDICLVPISFSSKVESILEVSDIKIKYAAPSLKETCVTGCYDGTCNPIKAELNTPANGSITDENPTLDVTFTSLNGNDMDVNFNAGFVDDFYRKNLTHWDGKWEMRYSNANVKIDEDYKGYIYAGNHQSALMEVTTQGIPTDLTFWRSYGFWLAGCGLANVHYGVEFYDSSGEMIGKWIAKACEYNDVNSSDSVYETAAMNSGTYTHHIKDDMQAYTSLDLDSVDYSKTFFTALSTSYGTWTAHVTVDDVVILTEPLKTITDVPNNSQASTPWSNLNLDTTYDWYVTATDGINNVTFPSWSFKTLSCYSAIDCGTNSWVGSPSCNGDDVWQDYRTYTCANPGTPSSSCTYSDNYQLKEGCTDTCTDGNCDYVECVSDSDCGTAEWRDEPFCKNEDVYQYYFDYVCIDPGTVNSRCLIPTNLSVNKFTNNEEAENLTFTSEGVITRYLELPKNSTVTQPTIDLKGYGYGNSIAADSFSYVMNNGDNVGNCIWSSESYFTDGNENTYAYWDCTAQGSACSDMIEYIDFTVSSANDISITFYVEVVERQSSGATSYYFWNYTSENWEYLGSINTIGNNIDTFDLPAESAIHATSLGVKLKVHQGLSNPSNCIGHYYRTRPFHINVNYTDGFTYPTQIIVDALDDSITDYQDDTKWNGMQTSEDNARLNATMINNFLANCVTETCTFPITFSSQIAGVLEVSDINIEYKVPQLKHECSYGCDIGQCITCAQDTDCGVNYYSELYCSADDVYLNYTDYTCSNPGTYLSSCSNTVTQILNQSCVFGCSSGQCIACSQDIDCGIDIYSSLFCLGDELYQFFTDYTCNNPGTVSSSCSNITDPILNQTCAYGCDSGQCISCLQDSDCGTDTWIGSPTCNGDDVWQDYRTYTCSNPGTLSSSCMYSDNYQLKEDCTDNCYNGTCALVGCSSDSDCGTDTWIGSPTCNGDDVWQDYRTYTCSNPGTPSSSCSHSENYQLKEDCLETCDSAACVGFVCSSNSDCGTDTWTGTAYCNGDDVWQDFRTYTCTNPGTGSASCSYSDNNQFKETCTDICYQGTCAVIECNSDTDCDDSDPDTEDKCINPSEINSYCENQVNLTLEPACFSDSDCDDSDPSTTDSCVNPGQVDAYCVNEQLSGLPDLVVSDLRIQGKPEPTKVVVRFKIKNIGDAFANDIGFMISTDQNDDFIANSNPNIDLNPLEDIIVYETLEFSTNGTYNTTVILDYTNTIIELNENNNLETVSVQVG